jgi:hypothetical protein
MTQRKGLLLSTIAAVAVAMIAADSAYALFGRGGGGSCGSWGGSHGGYSSRGGNGSWGGGSFGGRRHHRHHDNGCHDDCGGCESQVSDCGCNGGSHHDDGSYEVRENGERHESGYRGDVRDDRPMPAPELRSEERTEETERQEAPRENEAAPAEDESREAAPAEGARDAGSDQDNEGVQTKREEEQNKTDATPSQASPADEKNE